MKFRAAKAIGLQSISPILHLVLSIVITRLFGPENLGLFSFNKAWFDVLIAAGCFGFPQSVVLAVNRRGASRWQLYRTTVFYSLALVPALVLMSILFNNGQAISWVALLLVSFGAACVVVNNIWRGILLTMDDGLRFHLITAIPGFALVLIVAIVLMLRGGLTPDLMHFIFGGAGLLSIALSVAVFPVGEARRQHGTNPDYKQLSTDGLDVFVQTLTTLLQAYLCLEWLKSTADMAEVGYFGGALIVFTAFTFPMQAIAPMILNSWSKGSRIKALRSGAATVRRLAFTFAIGLATAILLMPWVVPELFGESFIGAIMPMQIVLASTFPAFWFRVASLRLAAAAKFRTISVAVVVRLLVILAMLWPVTWILPSGSAVTAVAICWLFGEIAAALVSQIAVMRYLSIYGDAMPEDVA